MFSFLRKDIPCWDNYSWLKEWYFAREVFQKNFTEVLQSTLFAHFSWAWEVFPYYFSQIHCSPNSLDHRAYLASSIHLTTSGERWVLPRNLLAGGSWGIGWSRASSRRRTPTDCCRLARQPALTEAGSRLSKSVCWQLISCETTNICSYFACGTLTVSSQVSHVTKYKRTFWHK